MFLTWSSVLVAFGDGFLKAKEDGKLQAEYCLKFTRFFVDRKRASRVFLPKKAFGKTARIFPDSQSLAKILCMDILSNKGSQLSDKVESLSQKEPQVSHCSAKDFIEHF